MFKRREKETVDWMKGWQIRDVGKDGTGMHKSTNEK